jgi:hypothetical protein
LHVTFDQWMQRTNLGVLSVRSSSLKSVDAALKNYDVFPSARHLRLLRRTFEQWKGEKADWKKSDRNRKGAVTDLDAMLRGPERDLSPMDYLLQEQQRQIDMLFRGRKLVTRKSKLILPGGSALSNLENIRRGALALGAPNPAFMDSARALFRSFFGAGGANVSLEVEVAEYLGREVLGDLVKGMAPYAGILTSGANAIYQFGKFAQAAGRLSEVHDCRTAVRAGDPGKAVAAIERVLSRDMTRHATQGTMAGFEAIARGAATTVGGPAAETVAAGVMSIAKLTFQVFVIGRDFQEKSLANGIMSGMDPVTYTVFDKYPLLGCYYVVCVDTSDVVNFMLDDMGTDNWMDDVEKLTKKMQPILQIARKLIADARFEIAHMPKLKKIEKLPKKALRGDYSGQGPAQPAIELE